MTQHVDPDDSPLTGPVSVSELRNLVERLTTTGPQSAFALRAGLMALSTSGVGASVTINIPRNPKDFLDVRVEL
jgi:hypothetical protein